MATSLPTPNLIAKPFANDGTKNTIPTAATGTNAASLSEGFPLLTATLPENGGLPPKRADVNGMGYLATQPLYALQNGYLETFRSDVSTAIGGYPAGARLWYQDSNGGLMLVKSLINNNTYNFNTNPAYIDGQKWTVDVQSIPSVAGQSGKFLSNNGTSAFWSKGVVGMVSPYAGTTAPDGWLICDGSAISRTTYSDLFSVIGTIYGSGDGSTTFNLPNIPDIKLISNNVIPSLGVKGNGKTMGWSNGSQERGTAYDGHDYFGICSKANINANIGSSINSNRFNDSVIGLIQDSSKSGIITNSHTISAVSVKGIIKY